MTHFLIEQLRFPPALAGLVVALWACFLIVNLVAVGALFFIWLERKVAGRIQDRLGPTRVGGKFGWLQTLADGLKLITKEDLMPGGADGLLFKLAPYISFCASLSAFIALPFATGWVGLEMNVAVFFVLAVLGLEVFGVILAGYSSASKWSLFGAMREAAQVVSYEVPLGLCVLVPVLIAGTMDLTKIGNLQAGWFTNWYVLHDPFTFITFWVFFTCATASVNRAPFDLAEAESELVAGFHTEYSGLRWSFFFMAEYGSMLLVSGLGAILFFGGWNGPIPIAALTGLAASDSGIAIFAVKLLGVIGFLIKAIFGVTFMMWIRWTLPRLRIDQVITTCWKYCTPIAAVMFTGVIFWQALGIPNTGNLLPPASRHEVNGRALGRRPGEVREQWLASRPTAAPAKSKLDVSSIENQPQSSTTPTAIITQMQPDDPILHQSFLPGDTILEINGMNNPRFTDLQEQMLISSAVEGINVVIQRPGQKDLIHLKLTPDNAQSTPNNSNDK